VFSEANAFDGVKPVVAEFGCAGGLSLRYGCHCVVCDAWTNSAQCEQYPRIFDTAVPIWRFQGVVQSFGLQVQHGNTCETLCFTAIILCSQTLTSAEQQRLLNGCKLLVYFIAPIDAAAGRSSWNIRKGIPREPALLRPGADMFCAYAYSMLVVVFPLDGAQRAPKWPVTGMNLCHHALRHDSMRCLSVRRDQTVLCTFSALVIYVLMCALLVL
jgi:hypothetical protein